MLASIPSLCSERRTDPAHPSDPLARRTRAGWTSRRCWARTCCPSAPASPRGSRSRGPGSAKYRELSKTIADEGLHTVCQEAACPNIGDCWDRGTATFMILGDTCTRRCGFCNVKTGKPTWNDPLEPLRVARSVARMGLRHAVITSVDRDDLPDYGASVWCGVIRSIRMQAPGTKIECLTPDFRGEEMPLAKVIAERPDVFNHNVEVVPRLYPVARRGSRWQRSLRVLVERAGDGRGRGRDQVGPDGRPRRDPRGDGRGLRRSARGGRLDPHRRPVPASDRAPPAGRRATGSRRSSRRSRWRPTSSASSTSPPGRSSARATTRTSTSKQDRPGHRAARWRPLRSGRELAVRWRAGVGGVSVMQMRARGTRLRTFSR